MQSKDLKYILYFQAAYIFYFTRHFISFYICTLKKVIIQQYAFIFYYILSFHDKVNTVKTVHITSYIYIYIWTIPPQDIIGTNMHSN